MKYVDEMSSGAMLYLPSFVNICLRIQKLIGRIHRHTDIQVSWRSHKPTFIFFKIWKVD
jgi:hypothetical protein